MLRQITGHPCHCPLRSELLTELLTHGPRLAATPGDKLTQPVRKKPAQRQYKARGITTQHGLDRAHNPKVGGSNPPPATRKSARSEAHLRLSSRGLVYAGSCNPRATSDCVRDPDPGPDVLHAARGTTDLRSPALLEAIALHHGYELPQCMWESECLYTRNRFLVLHEVT